LPTIDLSGYFDERTGETNAFDRLLIKKSIRDAISDLLYELMKSPLNHVNFKRQDINYYVVPSIDSVDENRFFAFDEAKTPTNSPVNDPELPGLYVVFDEDVVDREQITTINWSSDSILRITYFRKNRDNPNFDPSMIATTLKGKNSRKIPYSQKTLNLLVEDLETIGLMFDLEIQKTAQAGLIPGVSDTRLDRMATDIPTDTGRVYGSIELSYTVRYRVDYRNLGRK